MHPDLSIRSHHLLQPSFGTIGMRHVHAMQLAVRCPFRLAPGCSHVAREMRMAEGGVTGRGCHRETTSAASTDSRRFQRDRSAIAIGLVSPKDLRTASSTSTSRLYRCQFFPRHINGSCLSIIHFLILRTCTFKVGIYLVTTGLRAG